MQGTLVSLRSLQPDDSALYFKWINNRELVQKNSHFKPISVQEHEQWFNQITFDKSMAIFSLLENKNNTLIGSCSLRAINFIHKNAELQIRIGETNDHNKGFGTEAVRLLVQYGFNDLNLERIYLHVFANNAPAIRAYEKCGFIREGVLRKAVYIDGNYLDVVVMSIIK